MLIGDRLKQLREHKNLSQGDIEKRTGLICAYISRVENCHSTPSIETLEKFARALEVPMYALFYEGEKPPKPVAALPADKRLSRKELKFLAHFRKVLGRVTPKDQKLLLIVASKMAQTQSAK
jgi:transcriptional regulator with XRE-family HTH domain